MYKFVVLLAALLACAHAGVVPLSYSASPVVYSAAAPTSYSTYYGSYAAAPAAHVSYSVYSPYTYSSAYGLPLAYSSLGYRHY
ncbi:hypothetical protein TKK_0007099 [Trichogramma kaykai]